jgi:Zn-finger nucleic acid-binding protein
MRERSLGLATVSQCPEGHGVFLDRADLGTLIEAETDWHAGSGTQTAPLPRITPDMTAPPTPSKRSRAWVETLFG